LCQNSSSALNSYQGPVTSLSRGQTHVQQERMNVNENYDFKKENQFFKVINRGPCSTKEEWVGKLQLVKRLLEKASAGKVIVIPATVPVAKIHDKNG
jgi:hypothetical protein